MTAFALVLGDFRLIMKYTLTYNRCATAWLASQEALLCLVLWVNNFGLKLVTGDRATVGKGIMGSL